MHPCPEGRQCSEGLDSERGYLGKGGIRLVMLSESTVPKHAAPSSLQKGGGKVDIWL